MNLQYQNIIVRMPNWLGDLVMATPILADLREKWPQSRITALCQTNVAPLLEHNPNINEILSFKKSDGYASLRKGKFDLGVLLTNSFSSAWRFWRGNVKNRIGFSTNFRSLLLNETVPFPENMETEHLVKSYKTLLEPLGIPVSGTPPTLYVAEEEKETAALLLEKYGIHLNQHTLIGINPGAAFGSAKCWLPERFQEVTNRLLENPHVRILYFGDNAGASLVHDICGPFHDRVANLAGKTTIRELAALIDCCTAFLTNDSGPMHIAAALQKPLLALFGSTNEIKTGPYQTGKVIHKHVSCSPCYKRTCPIDFKCMKRISVEEVYQQLNTLIQHD